MAAADAGDRRLSVSLAVSDSGGSPSSGPPGRRRAGYPRFGVAAGGVMLIFFTMFGMFFLITQYFQLVLGYTPLGAGLRGTPTALALATTVSGERAKRAVGQVESQICDHV